MGNTTSRFRSYLGGNSITSITNFTAPPQPMTEDLPFSSLDCLAMEEIEIAMPDDLSSGQIIQTNQTAEENNGCYAVLKADTHLSASEHSKAPSSSSLTSDKCRPTECEKPQGLQYKCDKCEEFFSSAGSLKRHASLLHSIDSKYKSRKKYKKSSSRARSTITPADLKGQESDHSSISVKRSSSKGRGKSSSQRLNYALTCIICYQRFGNAAAYSRHTVRHKRGSRVSFLRASTMFKK